MPVLCHIVALEHSNVRGKSFKYKLLDHSIHGIILMSPQSKNGVVVCLFWDTFSVLGNYGHCPSASNIKAPIDDFGRSKVIRNFSNQPSHTRLP